MNFQQILGQQPRPFKFSEPIASIKARIFPKVRRVVATAQRRGASVATIRDSTRQWYRGHVRRAAVRALRCRPVGLGLPGDPGDRDPAEFALESAESPGPAPDERPAAEDDREHAARLAPRLLGLLTPREREVVEMRHGLGGGPPMRFGEIGARLGIAGTTADTNYRHAARRLRRAAEDDPTLDPYRERR